MKMMLDTKSLKRTAALLLALILLLSLSACAETGTVETDGSNGTAETETVDPEIQAKCDHQDQDNNGFCDLCRYDVVMEIELYAINDLHGKLLDSASQPGVDELTAYLKNEYKENENTILFSSGDMWQGSAESGLTKGNMMTDWMNEMDFAFMTLGNHEFDWGDKYIKENAELADFPFLAINVYDSETGEQAEFCQSSVTVDLGEVQIGFIGAIGDCYSSIAGDMSEGYYFITGFDLAALVKKESQKLRAQGADIIVYSIHDGKSGCDNSLTAGGYVDVVFEGHSHSAYADRDGNGVYHIQGGGENTGMSYAQVAYNLVNDHFTVSAKVITNQTYKTADPDDIMDELLAKYEEAAEMIVSPLGRNDIKRNSGELKQLVADLYASLAESRWGEYDVVLGGGYLSCRSPGRLNAGEVQYGDLYMLFPFDNRLALCSCSGSDLLYKFMENGNYYLTYTEYGKTLDKSNIDPNKTYYLITDSYNYTYDRNNLTVVEILDDVTFARDLLAEYIKEGGLSRAPVTESKPATIKELLEIAAGLPGGGVSAESYIVEGTVSSVVSTKYGNMYIEDAEGNQLYIYGIYQNGVRYDELSDKPVAGDTVKLAGAVKHYVDRDGKSVYEIENAELIEIN